jgi:hypothetical protein
MGRDPITTLFQLTDELQDLNMVQGWIDGAREAAPTNQLVQLELDRRQEQINRKRAWIAMVMLDIRSRN